MPISPQREYMLSYVDIGLCTLRPAARVIDVVCCVTASKADFEDCKLHGALRSRSDATARLSPRSMKIVATSQIYQGAAKRIYVDSRVR